VRPSVPIDTLLRLLYLKHRYGLGYESLCREVADSLSWRRFCRIPLDRPVPHPTTLVKLVGRAGPEVIGQLNAVLLGKLREGKLLRGRKLRVDTTVVEADIDHPTDADLLEKAIRKLGGLVRRIKGRGAATRTGSGTGRARPAGGSGRSPGRCGGAPGRHQPTWTGSPPRSPASPGGRCGRPSGWPEAPAARLPDILMTGDLGGWPTGWMRRPR